MTDPQEWLIAWFAHQAPNIKLDARENYFSAGAIDSMGIIELIDEVEQTFSVRFSQEDFQDDRFAKISGLAEMVSDKIAP